MKLNTEKYKLTIMAEDMCPDCIELKNKLEKLKIPFTHKSISANGAGASNVEADKEKAANRWEFIDLSREFPDKIKFSPVLVLENTEGGKDVFSLEGAFKNTDEAIEILKDNYCI
jgi:glutaredoxin